MNRVKAEKVAVLQRRAKRQLERARKQAEEARHQKNKAQVDNTIYCSTNSPKAKREERYTAELKRRYGSSFSHGSISNAKKLEHRDAWRRTKAGSLQSLLTAKRSLERSDDNAPPVSVIEGLLSQQSPEWAAFIAKRTGKLKDLQEVVEKRQILASEEPSRSAKRYTSKISRPKIIDVRWFWSTESRVQTDVKTLVMAVVVLLGERISRKKVIVQKTATGLWFYIFFGG